MVFLLVEDEQDRRPYITVAAQNTATAHLAIVTALYSESDITYASFFSRFCVLLIQPFKKIKKKKDLEPLCCELKQRRDGIVERLYAATAPFQSRCQFAMKMMV